MLRILIRLLKRGIAALHFAQPSVLRVDNSWYDTVSSRYDTYSNIGFQQQNECFVLIYTVNPTDTSAKAK